MKKLLLVTAVFLAAGLISAQSVFTLEGPSGTRVYTYFDSAIHNAVDGDYLYLPGVNINLTGGKCLINKRLTIIGAGHYPDSTKATGETILNGSVYFQKESSGSSIQGINIRGNILFGSSADFAGAKNIFISRCNFDWLTLSHDAWNGGGSESILIRENVIRGGLNCSYSKNVLIEANLIQVGVNHSNGMITVRNNIFLRSADYCLTYFSSGRFENNIFMSSGIFSTVSANNLFYNNIFKEGDPGIESQLSINNKFNVTNLFVNQSGNSFEYSQDYHLTANSPARNAGLDGKDCGIYGGASPYKEGALPFNPHISIKSIPGQTDMQGKLNIQVTVTAQQH
jgi:hypothetical protein